MNSGRNVERVKPGKGSLAELKVPIDGARRVNTSGEAQQLTRRASNTAHQPKGVRTFSLAHRPHVLDVTTAYPR
jgi:hypothetical protein